MTNYSWKTIPVFPIASPYHCKMNFFRLLLLQSVVNNREKSCFTWENNFLCRWERRALKIKRRSGKIKRRSNFFFRRFSFGKMAFHQIDLEGKLFGRGSEYCFFVVKLLELVINNYLCRQNRKILMLWYYPES